MEIIKEKIFKNSINKSQAEKPKSLSMAFLRFSGVLELKYSQTQKELVGKTNQKNGAWSNFVANF